MPAYVRVRDREQLRAAIEAVGTQTEIAARAGMSLQRINQLCTGVAPVIRASQAAVIEAVLQVPRGGLFVADEPHLIRAYLADLPDPAGEVPDGPPTEPIDLDAVLSTMDSPVPTQSAGPPPAPAPAPAPIEPIVRSPLR